MNTITIVGNLADDPELRYTPNGHAVANLRDRSFEDKDGRTRWVTEIEADEVAPSLRWATAKPVKADRAPQGQRQADPEPDEVPF